MLSLFLAVAIAWDVRGGAVVWVGEGTARVRRFIEYAFDAAVKDVTVTMFPPSVATGFSRSSVSTIRTRQEWGCPDGEQSRWTPAYTKVTHAVVHHGGDGAIGAHFSCRNTNTVLPSIRSAVAARVPTPPRRRAAR